MPEELRGTFAGLRRRRGRRVHQAPSASRGRTAAGARLRRRPHLVDKGLTNYWGYNTIGFFAPDPRYLATGDGIAEFKEMVARLHDAGIEVILDVVYNHTAEGNELGPTLCFKGIDNASYYRLVPDQPRYYIDDTGTGNTLNLRHPRVLQMVIDSPALLGRRRCTWTASASISRRSSAREPHGFDEGGASSTACRQDPVLASVKLIAEPWDVGPGGYQVGRFPPGWAEWNDRFRDSVRAYWKGDEGQVPDSPRVLTASGDIFNQRGRKPWASVNFITAHDGFTLNDLVSTTSKHNEANGEENRDGHRDNLSWNSGVEGPTDDAGDRALRERQKRKCSRRCCCRRARRCCLPATSSAARQTATTTPIVRTTRLAGSTGRDRREEDSALTTFMRRLVTLRWDMPTLRRAGFLHRRIDAELGVKDVTWLIRRARR